jgi:transposase
MLPVSKDTLLRVVRRRSRPPADPLRVIGIDDWAWRRNHRYASIVCNLEWRRIATLLPDREPATAQAWLAAHPTIAIVARDRGGGYGEAAAKALPHAIQVADRWHLMENASRAFLDAVRKSMRQIRTVICATTIDPKLLSRRAPPVRGLSAPREDQRGYPGSVEERHTDQADRASDWL